MPGASFVPIRYPYLVRYQQCQEGRNENVSALFPFQVSWHAVVGRLACLTVVPAFVIFNVTPAPE